MTAAAVSKVFTSHDATPCSAMEFENASQVRGILGDAAAKLVSNP